MDEYTREWETLVTRVPRLSESHLIYSFILGLKIHIQEELELHDITLVELARKKAKAVEKKFERLSW